MKFYLVFITLLLFFVSACDDKKTDNTCLNDTECKTGTYCDFSAGKVNDTGVKEGECSTLYTCMTNDACLDGFYCATDGYCRPGERNDEDIAVFDADYAEIPDIDNDSLIDDEDYMNDEDIPVSDSENDMDSDIEKDDLDIFTDIDPDLDIESDEDFSDDDNALPDSDVVVTTCGDGTIQANEVCDGNSRLCTLIDSSTFSGGTAYCTANCVRFDTSTCETKPNITEDKPDDNFIDSNGDGIDGNIEKSIFVDSVYGSDLNEGTKDLPVRSITKALVLATAEYKPAILIAKGEYDGPVTLKSNVSLYGGYSGYPDWVRSTSNFVTIKGSNKPVIISQCENIEMTYISINADDAEENGESSYGIFINSSMNISIRHSYIVSGNGKKGLDGITGATGASGSNGGTGAPGCESDDDLIGCGGNCSQPAYGSGGYSACGTKGGDGGYPGYDGSEGVEGSNNNLQGQDNGINTGTGGTLTSDLSCSTDGNPIPTYAANGRNGHNGDAGDDGQAGSAFGYADSSSYIPSKGGDGLEGTRGVSGGGGGGGKGHKDNNAFSDCSTYGSAGGGGGGAGCGGAGGTGGAGGGGSFAVWVNSSMKIYFDYTEIKTGTGGNGGTGGVGGTGGTGGNGGIPGAYSSDQDDAGCGGFGGNGGAGGAGGAGGGGGGGPSIGVIMIESSQIDVSKASFVLGAAGKGGESDGNKGNNGVQQQLRSE